MAWITAEHAVAALGVQRQTLYANVSRGRIRAKPDPRDSRRSLYNGDDINRLAKRGAGRRTVAAVAAEAIGWGDPVLTSGISTVADGCLWYRGQDAIKLSHSATLEQIADLLWEARNVSFGRRAGKPIAGRTRGVSLQAAVSALAARVDHDSPAFGRSSVVLAAEAAALVGDLSAAMLDLTGRSRGPLHALMASAFRAPQAGDILRRALVLLAEHELNASTFAVRVAASTGAPLAAGLLVGLMTLSGPLHGGAAAGVRALTAAARRIGAIEAVRECLAQGHPPPAFGHPLYPDGDPRAIALLEQFEPTETFAAVRAAVGALTGEAPNVDFAIAAMADAFDLPPSAPFTIFAVARSVGWVAHILEQIKTGSLIRPRARYLGRSLQKSALEGG